MRYITFLSKEKNKKMKNMNIICDPNNHNYIAILVFILSFVFFRLLNNYYNLEDEEMKRRKIKVSMDYFEKHKEENERFFFDSDFQEGY